MQNQQIMFKIYSKFSKNMMKLSLDFIKSMGNL